MTCLSSLVTPTHPSIPRSHGSTRDKPFVPPGFCDSCASQREWVDPPSSISRELVSRNLIPITSLSFPSPLPATPSPCSTRQSVSSERQTLSASLHQPAPTPSSPGEAPRAFARRHNRMNGACIAYPEVLRFRCISDCIPRSREHTKSKIYTLRAPCGYPSPARGTGLRPLLARDPMLCLMHTV